MKLTIPGVFSLGGALLSACGNTAKPIDTSTVDRTGVTASGTPAGQTTPAFSVTVTWTDGGGVGCDDSVRIQIVDPLGVQDWDFGMIRSDYSGEDCLSGVCHPITVDHTLLQVSDCQAASVVPGSTTFFDASSEPETYYLSDRTGACFLWGLDVAYYAALGCEVLM